MDAQTLQKHRQDKAKHARWSPSAAAQRREAQDAALEIFHQILGVGAGASAAEIRAAYLHQSQLHHPDKPGKFTRLHVTVTWSRQVNLGSDDSLRSGISI